MIIASLSATDFLLSISVAPLAIYNLVSLSTNLFFFNHLLYNPDSTCRVPNICIMFIMAE